MTAAYYGQFLFRCGDRSLSFPLAEKDAAILNWVSEKLRPPERRTKQYFFPPPKSSASLRQLAERASAVIRCLVECRETLSVRYGTTVDIKGMPTCWGPSVITDLVFVDKQGRYVLHSDFGVLILRNQDDDSDVIDVRREKELITSNLGRIFCNSYITETAGLIQQLQEVIHWCGDKLENTAKIEWIPFSEVKKSVREFVAEIEEA